MAWPPTTHQDVQDEVTTLRAANPDYLRSGYYSLGMFTGMTQVTQSLSTSTAYARPFWVLGRRAFDRVGVNVLTAATASSGGLIQMAIYPPGGVPGTALVETSAVSSETTGAKEWTITQTLDPGVYWLGVRAVVSGCSIAFINSAEHNFPFVSPLTTPPASVGTSYSGYTVAVASSTVAGFPSAGAAWAGSQQCHLGCLRAA